MDRKRQFLITFLVLTIPLTLGEKSIDPDIECAKVSGKCDSSEPEDLRSPDEKNLSKRDSFFNENNEGDSNFDYSDKYSDYGTKKKIYIEKESENKFDQHREGSHWDERNRVSYNGRGGGMDGSKEEFDRSHSGQMQGGNGKSHGQRQDWDRSRDYHESGRQAQLSEERDSQYMGNAYSANLEMNSDENRRGFLTSNNNNNYNYNNNNNNSRDFRNHRDFNSGRDRMNRMHSNRYEMSSPSVSYSGGSNFGFEANSNLLKPDRAIIINLKTECPMLNPAKNQLMHKFLLSPKLRFQNPHHPSSSQLYSSNNQLFASNGAPSNLYYFKK